jgi:hypothetical protein
LELARSPQSLVGLSSEMVVFFSKPSKVAVFGGTLLTKEGFGRAGAAFSDRGNFDGCTSAAFLGKEDFSGCADVGTGRTAMGVLVHRLQACLPTTGVVFRSGLDVPLVSTVSRSIYLCQHYSGYPSCLWTLKVGLGQQELRRHCLPSSNLPLSPWHFGSPL